MSARLQQFSLVVATTFSAVAAAQPSPPASTPDSLPAAIPADEVVLVDGTVLVGLVEKQEPGKFVVIKLADGSEQTLTWDQIKSVKQAPRGPATEPTHAPDAPAPATSAPLTANVQSSSGEALTFTLAPPPTYAVNFALGGFSQYANVDSLYLPGGGVDMSVQGLIGLTDFPDRHGGNWNTIRVDGYFQIHGGGLIYDGNSNANGGFLALNGGIGLGYSYLHMRDLDLDYKQRGLGVAITWRLGEQQMWTFVNQGQGISVSNFAHGPYFQLLFPKYEAHNASLDYSWIGAGLVFWNTGGDSNQGLTMLELGGGATF